MKVKDMHDLLDRFQVEAERGGLSLDTAVYEAAKREPTRPILWAGNLKAQVAVMGRDLGWQEVRYGEPLIGDAGRRVREAVYEAVTGQKAPADDRQLREAMEHILFTNTVPYKPVGNKAYPASVKERFRPLIAEFLALYWAGDTIITLGTEAFKWYAPYAEKGAADAFWGRPDRYEALFPCELRAESGGQTIVKPIRVAPLPHPSPLNQTYWSVFPDMLRKRLKTSLRVPAR